MKKHSGDFQMGSEVWPGLGKLIEEAGEVMQVAGKLIATGGHEKHWDGSELVQRLEDELADLDAVLAFVITENKLDAGRIATRTLEKIAKFQEFARG